MLQRENPFWFWHNQRIRMDFYCILLADSLQTDTFIVFYFFILHSITCLNNCHFTACLTSLYLFMFSMLILHVTSSRFSTYLLNVYHFTYTFLYAHTEAHTHKHTCIISTQKEWRQPDTGAWLKGPKKGFCSRQRPCKHTKKGSGEKEKQSGKNWYSKIYKLKFCTFIYMHVPRQFAASILPQNLASNAPFTGGGNVF